MLYSLGYIVLGCNLQEFKGIMLLHEGSHFPINSAWNMLTVIEEKYLKSECKAYCVQIKCISLVY